MAKKKKKEVEEGLKYIVLPTERDLKRDEVIEALKKNLGKVSLAAKFLKVPYKKVKEFIDKDLKVREELTAIEERLLDVAEAVILNAIKEGDVEVAKWYLKHKGKRRGYFVNGKDDKGDIKIVIRRNDIE